MMSDNIDIRPDFAKGVAWSQKSRPCILKLDTIAIITEIHYLKMQYSFYLKITWKFIWNLDFFDFPYLHAKHAILKRS